jgi:DDE superfamily endonuclease
MLKPWQKQHWCIPSVGSEFVWRMEDVLDLYALPADPAKPRVCFDECPYQLLDHVRDPLPPGPGHPARQDSEYEREGTCNLFLFLEPSAGWRHVEVTRRRTKHDFAQAMKDLVDVHFPTAPLIQVVLDNLNTHTPASLYEAFEPEEARRIARRLEFHYTPKHGSWLNMAEIELSVLGRQCLDQRLPSMERVRAAIAPWQQGRNAHRVSIQWRFTTADAREKLHRLYPSSS